MKTPKQKREIAQSEARDKTAKIISGLVPGGGSVYETFTAIVQPLHERRREEWVREVTLRLHKLEQEKKINLKELAENEEFNTIITKATLLAQLTHQKEKLEALRNVVLNSAEKLSKNVMDFEEVDFFLSILSSINPIQIWLLKFAVDPVKFAIDKGILLTPINKESVRESSIELKRYLFAVQPDLQKKEALIEYSWNELSRFGFVKNISFESVMPSTDVGQSAITDEGKSFLAFISLVE
jgi:hypothetical protein